MSSVFRLISCHVFVMILIYFFAISILSDEFPKVAYRLLTKEVSPLTFHSFHEMLAEKHKVLILD